MFKSDIINFFQDGCKKRNQLNIGVWICRLCHKGVHKLYSEIELAKSLNNLESLKNDLKVQRHIEWSRKQKISEPSK